MPAMCFLSRKLFSELFKMYLGSVRHAFTFGIIAFYKREPQIKSIFSLKMQIAKSFKRELSCLTRHLVVLRAKLIGNGANAMMNLHALLQYLI